MDFKQLSDAARPFVSDTMEYKTRAFKDDTPICMEVFCGDGYVKTITLGQWRKLWKILESS